MSKETARRLAEAVQAHVQDEARHIDGGRDLHVYAFKVKALTRDNGPQWPVVPAVVYYSDHLDAQFYTARAALDSTDPMGVPVLQAGGHTPPDSPDF